ncbi:caspase family protein [Streptomyces sp. NPDC002587]
MEPKLSDPARSRAVIVGTSRQAEGSDYRSLPAVARNVARMSELFRDPAVWGLPRTHCVELLDASRDEVFTALASALKEAEDTVVFYFAGHGMRHLTTNEFYLCLPGARRNGNYNTGAIRFADIRTTLLEPQYKVPRKAVILDCCFAGSSFDSMGDATGIDEEVKTPGTVALVSCDEMFTSKALEGAEYTAYTGQLAWVLSSGIPNGRKLLTLQEVHDKVSERRERAKMPQPRILTLDGGTHMSITRNVRGGAGPVPTWQSAEEEAKLGFEPDLYRTLSERLAPVSQATVNDPVPWDTLPVPLRRLDGERLLAFVDQSLFFSGRFLAFSNKRVIWRERATTTTVPYGTLRTMTVKVLYRREETGMSNGSTRVEPAAVEISSDSESRTVPVRRIGPLGLQKFLAEIRDAAQRHGITA